MGWQRLGCRISEITSRSSPHSLLPALLDYTNLCSSSPHPCAASCALRPSSLFSVITLIIHITLSRLHLYDKVTPELGRITPRQSWSPSVCVRARVCAPQSRLRPVWRRCATRPPEVVSLGVPCRGEARPPLLGPDWGLSAGHRAHGGSRGCLRPACGNEVAVCGSAGPTWPTFNATTWRLGIAARSSICTVRHVPFEFTPCQHTISCVQK